MPATTRESPDGHTDTDTIPPSKPSEIIQLQVGSRHFTTTRETLVNGSTYFESLLSERWETNKMADGSIFINADPNLFEHILKYLLRPSAPPIFYDIAKGHDFPLYKALLEEAKYFGVDGMITWLQDQKYIDAVQVRQVISEVDPELDRYSSCLSGVPSSSRVEYHPHRVTEKVYICPRGIPRHKGHPEACGRKCDRFLGDDPEEQYVDEEKLNFMTVKTTVSMKDP